MSISLHKPAEPPPGLATASVGAWEGLWVGKVAGVGGLSFSLTEPPHPHTAGEHKACPLLRCLSQATSLGDIYLQKGERRRMKPTR